MRSTFFHLQECDDPSDFRARAAYDLKEELLGKTSNMPKESSGVQTTFLAIKRLSRPSQTLRQ